MLTLWKIYRKTSKDITYTYYNYNYIVYYIVYPTRLYTIILYVIIYKLSKNSQIA